MIVDLIYWVLVVWSIFGFALFMSVPGRQMSAKAHRIALFCAVIGPFGWFIATAAAAVVAAYWFIIFFKQSTREYITGRILGIE